MAEDEGIEGYGIDRGKWEMETKTYVKFDIPETMQWLARDEDGSLYGIYKTNPSSVVRSWEGIGTVLKDEKNLVFITEDPNHYPQVKWSNEEPSQYDSGITLTTLCENEEAYVPQPSVPPIQNASDDTIRHDPKSTTL